MSKIKVIFADENGDDDLQVSEQEKERLMQMNLRTLNLIKKTIAMHLESEGTKQIIKQYLHCEYEIGDDNGHITITNFPNMCSELASYIMDTTVELYRLDLIDDAYRNIEAWVTNLLMIQYDDYMSEVLKDIMEDINERP